MYRVSIESVAYWGGISQGNVLWRHPLAVNVVCPHCATKYGFSLENRINTNNLEHGQPVKVLCPGCRELVRFFIVEPGSEDGDRWTGEMWMHPAPRTREPLPIGGLLSDRLVADYHDALSSFGHGLWRGAAQQARTVLEGVVKSLLEAPVPGKAKSTLAERLNQLAHHVDLEKPIRDVADVLREGGNVASHFDERLGVDKEMAAEMLDLLDAFIEYLILLPTQVERVKDRLEEGVASDTPGTLG